MANLMPSPSASGSDSRDGAAPASALVWLDALPIAAALILPLARGNFRLHASNSSFDQLGLSSAGTNAPVEMIRAVASAAESSDGYQEFCCRIGEGEFAVDMHGHLKSLSDDSEQPQLFLLTLIDHTQQVKTERSLRRELVSDPLTGLPNRSGFVDRVKAYGRSGNARAHAILLLNLSRFSRINEHIGPSAGDELITAVSRRLKSNMRGGDMLARTGGDEFAILSRMSGTRGDVRELARRIHSCFEHPFRIGNLTVSVACAIGGSIRSSHAEPDESGDDFRQAQIALKRAKHSGRIEIYEPEAPMLSDNRFGMETDLRNAIEDDRLTLAFQPLISFGSGHVAGFEALARWQDEQGNPISPNEFIPVAEDSGLIVPLGQWAINKAAAVIAEWDVRNGGTPVDCYFSVNVSAIQLLRDDVVDVTRRALTRHGIGGERMMIELTESAIIGEPDHALKVLSDLKALKTRIAMDDFGTGYSNLAYLQRLPIDVLKIDRSFVEHMVDDRDQVAIVRTIQSLAEALNLQTTAEGVETHDQARLLSALGCDFGQGFLFARPMDSLTALDYWRRSLDKPVF
jgi:diguanylate cyclase (GGDEF)-like protein